MAKRSIPRTPKVVESRAGTAAAPEPHPFLSSLNANYTIDPNSETEALLDDATGLLSVADFSLLQLCCGDGDFDDERLHGIRYMVEMAKNAVMAAHLNLMIEGKFPRARAAKGGAA